MIGRARCRSCCSRISAADATTTNNEIRTYTFTYTALGHRPAGRAHEAQRAFERRGRGRVGDHKGVVGA